MFNKKQKNAGKIVILVLLVLCMLGSVVVQAKEEITVGAEAGGPYQEFYKKLTEKHFTPQTGIKVNWIDVPHAMMHEKFLAEALSGAGAIDVFNADQPWIPEFAVAGFLVRLDEYLSPEERGDFFEASLNTVMYDEKIYALPYLVHNEILYYRTDLFDQMGIPGPPKTWDEYTKIAKKLTLDTNGDGEVDIYGTIVEGKEHVAAAAKFLDIVYQAGGRILDEEGNVAIDQAWIDAFNLYLKLIYEDKSVPPGSPSFDNADTHNLLIQGKLAMAPGWPYMYSMAYDPKISKVVGKIAVAEQPGKVRQTACVFSWGYCINSASRKKEAAVEFLKFTSGTDALVELAKYFKNPVARRSAMNVMLIDPEISDRDKAVIQTMTKAVEHGQTILMIPDWPKIHDRIAWALSAVTSRMIKPEEAVGRLSADIKKILKK